MKWQELMKGQAESEPEITHDGKVFRLGDKVVMHMPSGFRSWGEVKFIDGKNVGILRELTISKVWWYANVSELELYED
jgi:hypothetical protein